MRRALRQTRPEVKEPSFQNIPKPLQVRNASKSALRKGKFQLSGFEEFSEFIGDSEQLPAFKTTREFPLDSQLDKRAFPPQPYTMRELQENPQLALQNVRSLIGNEGSNPYRNAMPKINVPNKFKSGPQFTKPKEISFVNKVRSSLQEESEILLRGQTFMSDHDRIRKELQKVGINVQKTVYDEAQKDLKLGRLKNPSPKVVSKSLGRKLTEEIDFDAEHRNELRKILKDKPKEDKSFTSIQKRIQEQREEWKKLKTIGTLGNSMNQNVMCRNRTRSRVSSSDRFMYTNLKQLEEEPSIKDTETVVNEKLAEISRQFRETLKLSSNPKNYMKTSKHSSIDYNSLATRSKAILDAKESVETLPQKSDQDAFANFGNVEMQINSKLLSRPDAKFSVKGINEKTKGKSGFHSQGTRSGPGQFRRPNVSNLQNSLLRKSNDPNDSSLNLAGIVKLRSLLEANNSELFAEKVQEGGMDDYRRNVDPEYPHQPLQKIIGPPKNVDPYMESRKVMKDKQDRELSLEITPETPITKTRDNIATAAAGSQKKIVRISMNVQTSEPETSNFQDVSVERVQEKIGSSVKTLDEAARVANALGSLMARVAASRNEQLNLQKTIPGQPEFKSRHTAELHKMIMTEGNKNERGNQTGREIQTQTDNSLGYYSMKPPIPEIQFKRDMSNINQRRLVELRAKKLQWDAELRKRTEVGGYQ